MKIYLLILASLVVATTASCTNPFDCTTCTTCEDCTGSAGCTSSMMIYTDSSPDAHSFPGLSILPGSWAAKVGVTHDYYKCMDSSDASGDVTVTLSSACACLKVPNQHPTLGADCKGCIDSNGATSCAFCTTGEAGLAHGCIQRSFDNEDACKGYIDWAADCPASNLLKKDRHPFLRAVSK